ncbi:hypothetical protein PENTCL1PPCAC_1663 [Pristionchus entomophagus]|uniref:Uncharacterized protein n=1 Tax=Pristionchus entomophagus TaxID=358040 RepID=A0AAV5S9I4_9BILA|nr:hypothetical protein PENTCL1PPCAC_1663 [Pristionchus entomophagus]
MRIIKAWTMFTRGSVSVVEWNSLITQNNLHPDCMGEGSILLLRRLNLQFACAIHLKLPLVPTKNLIVLPWKFDHSQIVARTIGDGSLLTDNHCDVVGTFDGCSITVHPTEEQHAAEIEQFCSWIRCSLISEGAHWRKFESMRKIIQLINRILTVHIRLSEQLAAEVCDFVVSYRADWMDGHSSV